MLKIEPPEELTTKAVAFAASVEIIAPGLLVRVYLTGSGAAGDWQPGSDIDLVFETSRKMTDSEGAALERAHAETASSHAVDGVYLTEAQIGSGPDKIESAPQSVAGEFVLHRPGAQLTWVTWLEMQQGIVAPVVAGQLGSWSQSTMRPDDNPTTADRAIEVSRENLQSYWLPYALDVAERLEGRADDEPVSPYLVEWVALGAPRLIVTIETGAAVSKAAGGQFAAQRWPVYSALLMRVLAARRGEAGTFTVQDARHALALVHECAKASA